MEQIGTKRRNWYLSVVDTALVSVLHAYILCHNYNTWYSPACQLQTDCPEHSNCIEHDNVYTCECKEGFLKDGNTCVGTYAHYIFIVCVYFCVLRVYMLLCVLDVDECRNGAIDKYGHYCPRNAKCINTQGAFTCQCPKGYQFIDKGGFRSTCSGEMCIC